VTEGTTASSGSRARPGVGWIAKGAELVARIGVDPEDGEDLRQKKALLVPSCGRRAETMAIRYKTIVWGSTRVFRTLGRAGPSEAVGPEDASVAHHCMGHRRSLEFGYRCGGSLFDRD
jgi:hypothetical protein